MGYSIPSVKIFNPFYFLFIWSLIHVLSSVAAFAITLLVIIALQIVASGIIVKAVFPYLLLPGYIILSSIGQRQVLGGYLEDAGGWLVATAAGWGLSLAILYSFSAWGWFSPLSSQMTLMIAAAYIGLTLGFFQWMVLKEPIKEAAWWIPVSSISWALIIVMNGASIDPSLETTLIGVAPAVLQGMVMTWLLRQPQHKSFRLMM